MLLAWAWLCLRTLVALGAVLAAAAYVQWERVESQLLRRLFVTALQRKLKVPVTLEGLSIRREGLSISCELRGLLIANAPGEWTAPHAVHLRRHKFCARPLAYLSLPGLARLPTSLELCIGFRVKEIETIEFEGLSINVEDASSSDASAAEETTLEADVVVKAGVLTKHPRSGFGAAHRRLVVLTRRAIQWFEEGKDPASDRPKGSLRLTPSASVRTEGDVPRPGTRGDDLSALLTVTASGEELVLAAPASGVGEWARAIRSVAAALAHQAPDSNAPWVEALLAARREEKKAWLIAAQRRRQAWELATPQELHQLRRSLFAGRHLPGADFLARCKELHASRLEQLQRLGAKGASAASEERLEEAVEWLVGRRRWCSQVAAPQRRRRPTPDGSGWRVGPAPWLGGGAAVPLSDGTGGRARRCERAGRLRFDDLTVAINGQQLTLAGTEWKMEGFVGSIKELKACLLFDPRRAVAWAGVPGEAPLGLASTLLRETGRLAAERSGEAMRSRVLQTTEELQRKAQHGVAAVKALAADAKAKGLTAALKEKLDPMLEPARGAGTRLRAGTEEAGDIKTVQPST